MVASNLSDVIMRGTHSARPVEGIPGRLYYETDTGLFWRDSGAAWESMNAVASDNMIAYSKTPVTVNPDNSQNTLVDSLYFRPSGL